MAMWAGSILFFGVLFYWPLAQILSTGFRGNWFATIATTKIVSIVWFTIWQAALSAGLSLLFGILGAYLLYHRFFSGQKFIRALITVPFMLPTIVVAIGFTAFRELPVISDLWRVNSGVPIIICANVFMNYSLAVRVIGGVWQSLDLDLDEAAALDGAGRIRTFTSVTLPQLATSIASVGSLIFLYCAANFGLVLVLGGASVKTLETEIYRNASYNLDLDKAAGLVLLQTILTVSAFMIAQRLSKSGLAFLSTTTLQQRPRIDRRDLPALIVTGVFIGVLICLPLASVIWRAFQVENSFGFLNFTNLGGFGARDLLSISMGQATINTLRNAAITTLVSMSFGLVASFLLSRPAKDRNHSRLQHFMDLVFQIPIGISSLVLGLGYLVTFGDGLFPLRSSWLVTPIAQSLLTIPLVIRIIYPSIKVIDYRLRESAQTESASPSQIWWLIEVPIIRNVLLMASGYCAIIAVGEFGAANFLAYGDQATLPTVLYQLISRSGAQNYGMAMAASSLLIIFATSVVYLLSVLEKQTITT